MYYQKEGKMYFQKEVTIGKMEKGYIIILRTKKNPEFPDEDVYVTLDEVLKRVKEFLEE
jgi:hypothetical protein